MSETLSGKHAYSFKTLLWGIVCFGIILRLAQYIFNRSLWLDEVLLALNIIERTWGQLFQRLSYAQGAPIGFLLLQKLLVTFFGENEYVLRFIPLVCGIISLLLLYKILVRFFPNKGYLSFVALGLFSLSERLVFYSSEAKQYSSDVVITLLIFYAALHYIRSKQLPLLKLVLFAVSGAVMIWCSHPAVFVLAGVGISLFAFCLIRKEWAMVGRFTFIFLIWAGSFIGLYILLLQDLSHHKYLLNFWKGGFMPFPPSSLSDAFWFVKMFFGVVAFLVGLSASSLVNVSPTILSRLSFSELLSLQASSLLGLAYIVLLTCVTGSILLTGCLSAFRKNIERWFLFISPIAIALVASGLEKYPFSGRLILFLFPSLLFFIAEGADLINRKVRPYMPVTNVLVCCLLFAHPFLAASYYVVKPRIIEEVRPVVQYVGKHLQDGDILYVNHEAGRALQYYGNRYGIEPSTYHVGDIDIDAMDEFVGHKRVWIMFSHIFLSQSPEIDAFLNALERKGRKIDSFTTTTGVGRTYRVGAYLYDLSPREP